MNLSILVSEICPQTWRFSHNGTCQCGHSIHSTVDCGSSQVSILECHCMTFEEEPGIAVVGTCPYGCGFQRSQRGKLYSPLPGDISSLNDAMCGRLNRDGRMCSKCKKGFSPLVYTYDFDCIRCLDSKYIQLVTILCHRFCSTHFLLHHSHSFQDKYNQPILIWIHYFESSSGITH